MADPETGNERAPVGETTARGAAKLLRRTTDNAFLKRILGKYLAGEFETAEVQDGLLAAIDGEVSVSSVRDTAKLLRQTADNAVLKRILGMYLAGEIDSSDVQDGLLAAIGGNVPETSARDSAKLLRQTTDNPVIKRILGMYLGGQIESAEVQDRLVAAIAAEDLSGSAREAAKSLRHLTDNALIKRILNKYLGGEFETPEIQNGLLAAIGAEDAATSAREAAKLLRQTTDNTALKRIVGMYLGGQIESSEIQDRLLAATNSNEPIADCIQRLRRHVSDALKTGDASADAAPEIPLERLRVVLKLLSSALYFDDSMATTANATFLTDPGFVRAYEAGASISVWGCDIRWRVYTLLTCAEIGIKLAGDFVECGVDRGGTSMCVITHLGSERFNGRKFHLFDTFEGIPAAQFLPGESELSRIDPKRHPPVLEDVRRTFADADFVRIIPGIVPETLPQFTGKSVAYLHIDMNAANPERAAFEFFWPLLSKGAPVIFDDYGFQRHSKQKAVLDQAAERLGTKILLLPTCQGLLWK